MNTQAEPLVELLAIAGSMVAIAASALGLLVTMQQVTAPTRLRRQSAHWREELINEVIDYDALLFRSLRRQAISELLAVQAVPGRRIMEAAVWIIAACLGAFTVGKAAGDNSGPGYAGAAFSTFVILYTGIAMCLHAVLERKRIAKAYLDEKELIVSRHSWGRFNIGLITSALARRGMVALALFVASIWLTLLSAGIVVGASGSGTSVSLNWVILLFGLPLIVALLGIYISARIHRYHHEEWRHPRV